ncbi:hypothetical protein ACQ4PT_028375 [Festuca glaucescens]
MSILKRYKLSAEQRQEIGWESLDQWEFDNKTLAAKIAKLKRKQDGEVDNPPAINLAKEEAESTPVTKAKRLVPVASPTTGTRRSTRGKGGDAENMVDKASRRATELDPALAHSAKAQGTVAAGRDGRHA